MFDPQSRYAQVPDGSVVVTGPDGTRRPVSYKRRRFISAPAAVPALRYTPLQGERPDQISARFLGDPLQFWRICDANSVIRPAELSAGPTRSIAIPAAGR